MIIIGLLALAGYLLHRSVHTPFELRHASLTLAAGSSLRDFAVEVDRMGGSKGELPVLLWAYLKGISGSLKAGEYVFDERATTAQILDKVVRGDVVQYAITFPEGVTFSDMLELLQRAPQLEPLPDDYTSDEILSLLGISESSPEGLFFPDTYYYTSGNSTFSLLQRAHRRMMLKLDQAWARRYGQLPFGRSYDALILASIIEKEAGNHQEKARIGGVLVNRLRKNMRLQTDPTVIYGTGLKYQGDLTRAHLAEDTPYNTYRRKGLPPTPISCPGWNSLLAAVHPIRHEEYYFVSRGNGTHKFSKSLKELGVEVDLPKHFGFLMRWNVIGPFDNTSRKGFETIFPPEKEINFNSKYKGKEKQIEWESLASSDSLGKIDLNKPFGMLKETTAYAYTEFESKSSRTAELRLGCKNAWKIWVNGKFIFGRDEYHRGQRIDQYKLKIQLKEGKNTILVKACQNEQTEEWTVQWEFQLRICDEGGVAILASNREPTPQSEKQSRRPRRPKT